MRFVAADLNAPTIVDNDRGWGLPNDGVEPSYAGVDDDRTVVVPDGLVEPSYAGVDDDRTVVVPDGLVEPSYAGVVGAWHAMPLPPPNGGSSICINICIWSGMTTDA